MWDPSVRDRVFCIGRFDLVAESIVADLSGGGNIQFGDSVEYLDCAGMPGTLAQDVGFLVACDQDGGSGCPGVKDGGSELPASQDG